MNILRRHSSPQTHPADPQRFNPVAPTPSLQLHGFAASRGGRALSEPLYLTFPPGTVLGVVGPNGVGKSSFLSALAHTGVDHIGAATLGRHDLTAVSARDRARMVSLLPQDVSAPPEFLVRELVAVGARAGHRVNTESAVEHALNQLGILDLARRRFGTLSGGQQQLVQLARVLAQQAPVVIFDEPTSALDLFYQHTVEETMRSLGQKNSIVIAALHDLSFTLNTCTHVLLFAQDGTAVCGAPEVVLSADRVHEAYGVHTSIHTTPRGRRYLASDKRPPEPLP